MNKVRIKFHSIDFWSRPMFVSERGSYISSINQLYDKNLMGDTPESISEYFSRNISLLTYHGTDIDDDPDGRRFKEGILEIVNEF